MQNQFIYTFPGASGPRLQGLVTVPTGYKPGREMLPVILFLHGAGERGNDLEKVKAHGIPKLFCNDPDYHGLRVITLSHQCPANMVWDHIVESLHSWLTSVTGLLAADQKRIAVTGLSMGGYGAWEMLLTYPNLFCCGAPICGGGMPWRAGVLKDKPLRVYHGFDDPTVPVEASTMMVKAARNAGAKVEFTLYDNMGHGSWEPAYEKSDLVEWLISHRLP